MSGFDARSRLSLRRHAALAVGAIALLLGGLAWWAAATPIAGAVVASGTVVVESNVKKVQHAEGGIVSRLYVRNQDLVSAGQLLATLDDTLLSAGLDTVEGQLRQNLAKAARLEAELDGTDSVAPRTVEPPLDWEGAGAALLETERGILARRAEVRRSRASQIGQQIAQLERQIEGLGLQQAAAEQQAAILDGEIADFDRLFEARLVAASRGTDLDKALAGVRGDLGRLIAAQAEARANIAERRLQIAQLEDDFFSSVLGELQQVRALISDGEQQRRATLDRMARLEIHAPQAGMVHESILDTVGGVVSPGQTLMLIVPLDDSRQVEARIAPTDIDNVVPGQAVVLRLSSYNHRSTPELDARVSSVAADLSFDVRTGQPFYVARMDIAAEALEALPETVALIPGMPVETFIRTGDRTVLSYLVRPFAEQMELAFREE